MCGLYTQTFGLKEELNTDFEGTLRALREIGFDGIEPSVPFAEKQGDLPKSMWTFETLESAAQLMKELGLHIPSAHVGWGFEDRPSEAEDIAADIRMLRDRYGIRDCIVSAAFRTEEQAREWGGKLKAISAAIRPDGCRIIYHNHNEEFYPLVNDARRCALDIFVEETDGDIPLQLDIGWAGLAADELDALRKYAGLIVSLHLKDFYRPYRGTQIPRLELPREAFAPIGHGDIATAEALALRSGLPHFTGNVIIDQDYSAGSMLDALKLGHDTVRAMLAEKEPAAK